MVVANFSVTDKANWVRFFEKTFLVTNISLKVVFGMLFLTLSSANIDFLDWKFYWRIYTTKKAFLTNRHIELVEKKEFAAVVLDAKYKTFIIYVASLFATSLSSTLLNTNIYPFCRPQIAGLIAEKAFIKVFAKYNIFADVFFPDLVTKLFEHTRINNYAIKLVND